MRDMRDSGHPWLGMIPTDWDVVYPKMLFSQRKERAQRGERQLTASQQHGVVYQDEYMEMTGSRVVVVEKDFDILKHVEAGDFVISMRSFQGGIEYSENMGCISSAYVMLIPNQEYVYNRYFKWLLKSPTYINALQSTSNLVRDGQAMRFANFIQVWLPVIPIAEQIAIAEILDQKCSQVDALIANVQAQIEKLKAYKQSVITEVVTKGLDPSVPMKDSGIAWIGEIANTRRMYRLKFLLSAPMQYGANESGDKEVENSVRYIRITDITADGHLKDDDNNQYLPIALAESYLLKDKDVLFARCGGTVGKSFLYRESYGISAYAGYLIKAECDQAELLPEYLIYYTQSSLYELWKNMIFIQATIQNIGANKYSNMEIPVPSLREQSEIVEYLSGKCDQIDQLIALKQKKIDKLTEYKKSLIYEYVTGKKEVS